MAIDVRVDGAAVLVRGLEQAPGIVRGELADTMTRGLLLIERDARARVKQDTRQLMGSITHTPPTLIGGALVGAVGPSKAYGIVVERGRRPNKPMPPPLALRDWARRHGLPTDRSTLFLLARRIGRRGIKAAPFMAPAWEKNRPTIERWFAEAGGRVVGRVAQGGRG